VKLKLTHIPFLLLLLFSGRAYSQLHEVSGIVQDRADQPLPGVTVVEYGTSNGVITDLSGQFVIALVSDTSRLQVSFIGMESQVINVGGQKSIKVILQPEMYKVEEVVVTALGISKETKAIGYSATAVDNDALTQSGEKNMLNALQGKVAGVNITSASGAPGSSTRILMRGVSSLSGSNQPLVVIDGVPVNNTQTGSSSINGGTDFGNKLNDINVNDIESATFLKGASGTALYGSRAANGVIEITTRKGNRNQKAKVSYSGALSFEEPLRLVEYQNNYGQGIFGNSVLYENMSWGPAFDNRFRPWGNLVDGNVRVKSYRALPHNVEEFFETGYSTSHALSVGGGNEATSYFLSYSFITWDGIFPTESDNYNKHTFSLRGLQNISKNFSIAGAVNYIRKSNSSVPTGQGESSVYNQVMQTPRDISLLEQSDLSNPFNSINNHYSLYTVNPYHILYNNGNQNTEDRIFGSFDFHVFFAKNIKLKWRLGGDISNEQLQSHRAAIMPEGNNELASVSDPGSRARSHVFRQQVNSDVIISWNKNYKDFDISLMGGQAVNQRKGTGFGTVAGSQQLPGYNHLSNSQVSPTSYESSSMIRLIGVYGSADFSYKNLLYFSATGRNEWSSTLPLKNNSYFFPGVNAGFVFSELMPKAKRIMPFGKLRLSWAMVGNDAPPYFVESVYNQTAHSDGYGYFAFPTYTGVNSYEVGSFKANPELRPEMTTEYEAGLDLRFLNNRFSIDAAWYNKQTTDLIWASPQANSSGYSYQMQNLGTIQNYGVEGLVRLVPVQQQNFTWEFSINYTRNFNELLSLNNELEKAELNSLRIEGGQQIQWMAIPGEPVGVFEGRGPKYTEEGKLIVNSQGLPVADSELQRFGNSNYDYFGGITNSFTIYGITLSSSLDFRMGGLMYSRTKDITLWAGTVPETLYNDREPFIISNAVYESGRDENGDPVYTENTIPVGRIKLVEYWGNGGLEMDGASLIDKSFVKLRDVTLGYNLPSKTLEKLNIERLYIGISGKNLWLLTPSNQTYIDPELTTFGNDLLADFGEYGAQPSVRSVTFNLKIDF
jgi:TonB-linked SusC/RagA family outer membrane protein